MDNIKYSINQISHCRVTGEEDFITVLDLGNQYLTGVFPKTKKMKK